MPRSSSSSPKRSMGGYLRYAIGEVFLVVVGILIAVSINNWNSDRKAEQQLNGILRTVALDLQKDTVEISQLMSYYKQREQIIGQVMADTMTAEQYNNCTPCFSILLSFAALNKQLKGYNLIKNHVDTDLQKTDTLVTHIHQFYNQYINMLEPLEEGIKESVVGNMEHYRDNYPWFANLILQKPDSRIGSYMKDNPDYMNRVVYQYVFVYSNYLAILKSIKSSAVFLIGKIEERVYDLGKEEALEH